MELLIIVRHMVIDCFQGVVWYCCAICSWVVSYRSSVARARDMLFAGRKFNSCRCSAGRCVSLKVAGPNLAVGRKGRYLHWRFTSQTKKVHVALLFVCLMDGRAPVWSVGRQDRLVKWLLSTVGS